MKVNRVIKETIESDGLGARIRRAREADPRSLSELARLAGISRSFWYQVEHESVLGGISESTLRKIEEVLGVDFGVQFD